MAVPINQELLNKFYGQMKINTKSILRIDGLVAVLMQDNTSTIETILVDHTYYQRFRASEHSEWNEWTVRP